MVSPDAPAALIPQFYAGRALFITGATGFMGKVLVERLLWTCPAVDRLFLLIRRKKGVDAAQRLQEIKDSMIFSNIRQQCPAQLDKLTVVPGDITAPGLGILPEDFAAMKHVSIVFHSAATLKFDEPLGAAVNQNLRPVLTLLDVCDHLTQLEAFVYVSTAYSNAELSHIAERVYEPRAPLEQLLALADLPEHLLADLTERYIAPKPNTYTFTKAMAEVAVQRHGCRRYPVAIFRPTIVVSSLSAPLPGWTEGVRGPGGVLLAAGEGVLHALRARPEAKADLLPVDMAVHTMMAVAWETAVDRSDTVRVYNCSGGAGPTWGWFERQLRRNLRAHPLDRPLWYPSGVCATNRILYKVLEFSLQTVPLHLAEYTLNLLGLKHKLSLIAVSGRLRAMNAALSFFTQRSWTFDTDNVRRLRARLSALDTNIYNLDPATIRWDEHNVNFVRGTRKYLLRERDEDLPAARRRMRRLFFLHYGTLLLASLAACRLLLCSSLLRDAFDALLQPLQAVVSAAFARMR